MSFEKKASDPVDEIKVRVNEAKEGAKEVYREARPWLVPLARLGTGAKGVVYLALGFYILRAVIGAGSPDVDQRTTFRAIAQQAFFGPLLLGLIAIGLAGYVLWMFIQAVVDPQGFGSDARGLVRRGNFIFTGLGYAGLVLLALQVLLGLNTGPEMDLPDITARILGRSFGTWLVGLAGLGFLAYFVNLVRVVMTGKFKKELDSFVIEESEKEWAVQLGRIGLVGRGFMIFVIGLFLIQAAIRYNPEEAGGLGEVLRRLSAQPYGPWILGGVAIGLVAYGSYMIILVRYGRYTI